MSSITNNLFESVLFRITDFECRETPLSESDFESLDSYEISFTRSGYFFLNIKKESYEVYPEYILLGNQGIGYTVNHGRNVADKCTVIKINRNVLDDIKNYFWNKQTPISKLFDKKESTIFPLPLLKSTPQLDNLHFLIYSMLQNKTINGIPLKIELLILNLIKDIFKELYQEEINSDFAPKLKERHLETIELSKNFITCNFTRDISLLEIAASAFLSPFHFNRIFKKYTAISPYTYLIQFRLKYASLLLQNTNLSVTEICYQSGFNNFPHFITAFTKYFNMNPLAFRKSSKHLTLAFDSMQFNYHF